MEHRFSRRLACHHCGHETPPPPACPECGELDCLVACGPGVERIADEVRDLFPEARVAVVTSDTISSPEKAADFVAQAEGGAIDVIVGTQLVTKGFHFPELTLVGVVDADLGLEGGDLRGIIQKIDDNYFTDLGINAIWMTPIVEPIPQFWLTRKCCSTAVPSVITRFPPISRVSMNNDSDGMKTA